MSNPERRPALQPCAPSPAQGQPRATLISPRDVPLGGLRAMTVRRTLPAKERSLIGAWCFLDHYGPDDVTAGPGMSVPAHPHTGLQTVSWLFTGQIDHADSAGHTAAVRPGQLNLMTAGRGINHSEFTSAGTTILHGCQLWLALPEAARGVEPDFEHYEPEPLAADGAVIRVFLGSLLGAASPVRTHSPILGAEIVLDAGARLDLSILESFEHGVLVDAGAVEICGEQPAAGARAVSVVANRGSLAALDAGLSRLTLTAGPDGARVLLIGGEPFGEEILMWWNFVGRTDEEIRAWRAEWQEAIGESGPGVVGHTRFGTLVSEAPIPAPELPGVRLRPRGNKARL